MSSKVTGLILSAVLLIMVPAVAAGQGRAAGSSGSGHLPLAAAVCRLQSQESEKALGLFEALSGQAGKGTPGKDLIRRKKDPEQIMAYRENLEAFYSLNLQTGRRFSDASHNVKEIQ